jgi:hypothetical protein
MAGANCSEFSDKPMAAASRNQAYESRHSRAQRNGRQCISIYTLALPFLISAENMRHAIEQILENVTGFIPYVLVSISLTHKKNIKLYKLHIHPKSIQSYLQS